jgi:dihydroorotate dehydrogenase (fumarate)
MADLSTTYMGIKLKNPLILGASNLVTKPEIIKQIVAAGIGAIVYKSLFEEQIQLEKLQLNEELSEYENRNAEMVSLFPRLDHAGTKEHLYNLEKFKEATDVPVVASLNAFSEKTWVEWARELELAGADGLELNMYSIPLMFEEPSLAIEENQVKIVKAVKKAVTIPVAVKLSMSYTNPLNFIKKLVESGADGIVLFNRFFQPDIDTETEEFYFPWDLSNENDYLASLRFAGLLHGNVKSSICANRGIYTAEDVIKTIMAGADAVQVVSTVYKNQPKVIDEILETLNSWMDRKGYKTLDDFRGKLSLNKINDSFVYQRAQYVDILMNSEEVFKKHLMV